MTDAASQEFTQAFERVLGVDKTHQALERPFLSRAKAWQDSIFLGVIQSHYASVIWRGQNNEVYSLLEIDPNAYPTEEAERVTNGIMEALSSLRLKPRLVSIELKSVNDIQPFLEGSASASVHLREGAEPIVAGVAGLVWVVLGALLIWDDQTTALVAGAGPMWLLAGWAIVKGVVNRLRQKVLWSPASLKGDSP